MGVAGGSTLNLPMIKEWCPQSKQDNFSPMTRGRTDLSDNSDPSIAMLLNMNIYNNYSNLFYIV